MTKYVSKDDFHLIRYSTIQHELDFVVKCNKVFHEYSEVIVTEDSSVIYSGLIQKSEPECSYFSNQENQLIVSHIWCVGHQIRTNARTVSFNIKNMYAGEIVRNHIMPILEEEGITAGTIEKGTLFDQYFKDIGNIREIMSELSELSGFTWWVDTNKRLHFAQSPRFDFLKKEIDTTFGLTHDPLTHIDNRDLHDLKVSKDLSEYRNKQFAVGQDAEGNAVIGSWQNTDEIVELSQRYGTGVFGNVIHNEFLRTEEECRKYAEHKMLAYGGFPTQIEFWTYSQDFNILQLLYATLPQFGVKRSLFFVTKIDYEFSTKSELKRHITLMKVVEEPKGTRESVSLLEMPKYETPEQKMKRLRGDCSSSVSQVTSGSHPVTYWQNRELITINGNISKILTHKQPRTNCFDYGFHLKYDAVQQGSINVNVKVTFGEQTLADTTFTHFISHAQGVITYQNHIFGATEGTYLIHITIEKNDIDLSVPIQAMNIFAEPKFSCVFDPTVDGGEDGERTLVGRFLITDDYRVLNK